ncbi:hypothetical protein [Sinorhizobium saheli]|uniref:Uncharacterized protein n=1 Tax=Sinorhizobium saheli TaxID=36856 RepID=A0A178XQH7_SINSA|nr:hypothetical protein [Sinorhizobium saheli]MQW90353.1 hypothetical protein [Sinorhizobium saheli]OAP37012.1 hypothetical protein ATB98_21815 [Sinorhizobium saheli]
MQTPEDEITIAIAVDLAVLKPHQRRAFAGLDQYRRAVKVRGVPELAAKIAESFAPYAVFDGDQVLRYPAIAPFIAQTLYAIPIELRRGACDSDRQKACDARERMARLISSQLLGRYRFEHLRHVGASCHANWDAAFEARFGKTSG